MEAQHHSPARPSVDEDHRWKLLACIFRKKELAVNGEAVFTLEDHLLWRDQLLAGEILRQRVGGQHLAGVLALEPRQRMLAPSVVITGETSMVSPWVIACGDAPPATGTRQIWRRSTSSWFA